MKLTTRTGKISYPGNKGVPTIAPNLINLIPMHKVYWELCLGSGGLSRWLQLPQLAIGFEIDKAVVKKFTPSYPPGLVVINNCHSGILQELKYLGPDHFIYIDPPYPKSSRRSPVDIYNYEWSDEQHINLLSSIKDTRALVAISTYQNKLYDEMLPQWNKKIFPTCVHGKVAAEVVMYNYADPVDKIDYRFHGKNKTDRQRFKRKIARWINRLQALPAQERVAILNYLISEG